MRERENLGCKEKENKCRGGRDKKRKWSKEGKKEIKGIEVGVGRDN